MITSTARDLEPEPPRTPPGLRASIVPPTLAGWASMTNCDKFEAAEAANGRPALRLICVAKPGECRSLHDPGNR
jgi:hypothetical protein